MGILGQNRGFMNKSALYMGLFKPFLRANRKPRYITLRDRSKTLFRPRFAIQKFRVEDQKAPERGFWVKIGVLCRKVPL